MKDNLRSLLPRLGAAFRHAFTVKDAGEVMGKGLFEIDLERAGFVKKDLKALVTMGVIRQTTTRWKGGWRNTYVLPTDYIGGEEHVQS